MRLDINNRQSLDFNAKLIRSAARRTLAAIGFRRDCEVSVSLVTDDEIQELNLKYRGIDAPTDVLSFPLDDFCLGDIVISMRTAAAQAEEYGHSIDRELSFLTVHGMLHLLGYDHQCAEDEREMFTLQDRILSSMSIH